MEAPEYLEDPANFNGLVVVVDDNPTNLDTLLDALSDERLDLAVATDGRTAIDLIEREQPDLVLLDVLLPDINGFEVCRRLKESPQTADVQIVFMTSLSNREHRLQGLRAGAVDYISKPFDAERSEEHTSELQSQFHLVCRLLLEKKKKKQQSTAHPIS